MANIPANRLNVFMHASTFTVSSNVQEGTDTRTNNHNAGMSKPKREDNVLIAEATYVCVYVYSLYGNGCLSKHM